MSLSSIVFSDSDFKLALYYVLYVIFFNAEQLYATGAKLLLFEEDIYDEFIKELKKREENIKVENGIEWDTDMGFFVIKQRMN